MSASVKRFDTLVRAGNARVASQFAPKLQFQEPSLLHEVVTQAANLQLHAWELLPLQFTVRSSSQGSTKRKIYENKALPHLRFMKWRIYKLISIVLAKLAHVHWKLRVHLIFIIYVPRKYLLKVTLRFLLCWK